MKNILLGAKYLAMQENAKEIGKKHFLKAIYGFNPLDSELIRLLKKYFDIKTQNSCNDIFSFSAKELEKADESENINISYELKDILKKLCVNDKYAQSYMQYLNSIVYCLYEKIDKKDDVDFDIFNIINLLKESLEIAKILHIKNPDKWARDYTNSLHYLADFYCKENRIDDVKRLYKHSLKMTKNLYIKNPDKWEIYYAQSINDLGKFYEKNNKSNKSIKLYKKSLKMTKKLYIKNPSKWVENYTKSLNDLAIAYEKELKFEKSIRVAKKALKIAILYLGLDNYLTKRYLTNFNSLKRPLIICYNKNLKTIFHLAKAIAIRKKCDSITIIHLVKSLAFVELSEESKNKLESILNINYEGIEPKTGGKKLIKETKQYPNIPYDKELKKLIVILEKIFEDKFICRLRK